MSNIIDTEGKDLTVDTSTQISESDILVEQCKQLYNTARKNDLSWRWLFGKLVEETYANKDKYESGILKRMSEETDIAISDLSRFRKFFNEFADVKLIDNAAEKGYSWSHFKVLNDLPDGNIKQEIKDKYISTDDPAPKTSDFQKEIDRKKSEQVDRATASTDADSSAGGAGSGSSRSETKSSPITPVNKAIKTVEILGDYLGDVLININEGVNFDDDKKEEKYMEALSDLITRLKEMTEYANKITEAST